MKDDKTLLPQNYYLKRLTLIKGIKFTHREIDVIACLLNVRGASKTPSILSISPNTVEAHTYNIMKKIQCNSRENVIDFIEDSGTSPSFRNHYANILINTSFEKSLKAISVLAQKLRPVCLIDCYPDQEFKNFFLRSIEMHLKYAGISISIKSQKKLQSIFQLIQEAQEENFIIYIPLEIWRDHDTVNEKIFLSSQEKINSQKNILFLFSQRENSVDTPIESRQFNYIDLASQQNEYFLTFEIIEKIFPQLNIKKIISEFKEKHTIMMGLTEGKSPQVFPEESELGKEKAGIHLELWQILRSGAWRLALSLFAIGLLGVWFLTFQNKERAIKESLTQSQDLERKEELPTQAELVIPIDSALLNRPELIMQINESFNGQDGILTIALVGPGGAGKTTLARQYARQQKTGMLWEINAEKNESLKASFENLAQALSKTEKDQKLLREIQEIKKPVEREEKLIQFVSNHLKLHNNWLLIYDNVEKFADIQQYFPYDPTIWGKGKIIITTRDSNIENNRHIKQNIKIGALSQSQKLSLFMQIMTNGASYPLPPSQKEEINKFLNGIPSFPLDVSVAAYYLKATGAPYSKYLERLNHNEKEFAAVQKNLLKESGDYTKTRYSIVTLSLQHLIETHQDFRDLLLFISLLDSPNIPRELLNNYKSDAIIDSFIYNLRKYSLITNESPNLFHSIPTFSIHRNTQEIILAYFINTLNFEKRYELIQSISNTLKTYIDEVMEEEDFSRMKLLANLCENFLSHNNLLTDKIRGSIESELGYIYYYLGYYKKAQKLIEESLIKLNKHYGKSHIDVAWALARLGIVYKELGYYEKARNLLEQSLEIHKKHFSDNPVGVAWTLAHLGNVYKSLGEYENAKNLLEQSLIIYRKHVSGNYMGVARVLGYLGNVYRELGNYEQAKIILEQSLEVHQKHFSKNPIGIAQVLEHLGIVFRELGDFEKAKNLLEQSLITYKQHFSDDHVGTAWALAHLGIVYRELGNYEKAKNLLEQSLIIFKKHFSDSHVGAVWALAHLGIAYRWSGNYEKAKNLLEQSMTLHKELFGDDNIKTSWVLMQLGHVYKDLDNYEQAKIAFEKVLEVHKKNFEKGHLKIAWASALLGNIHKSLGNYKIAKSLFEKSLITYEKHYGKNHVESARILRNMGEVYFFEGHMESAQKLFNDVLRILQKNKHPDIYMVLEILGDLHLKKSNLLKSKGNLQQSQNLKKQAINYMKQALEAIKVHFPENSPHITRIQSKLKNIK